MPGTDLSLTRRARISPARGAFRDQHDLCSPSGAAPRRATNSNPRRLLLVHADAVTGRSINGRLCSDGARTRTPPTPGSDRSVPKGRDPPSQERGTPREVRLAG